jgi:uroporphyrinogen-III decarboxylase
MTDGVTETMTSKQRLEAALRGEAVDRVPIWLREGFPIVRGPAGAEEFRNGWQDDDLYRELFEYVRPHVDDWLRWGGFPTNRYCMVVPSACTWETISDDEAIRRTRSTVRTPARTLTSLIETHRHEATQWVIEPLCKDRDDLAALWSVPWELDVEACRRARASYEKARAEAGDRYAIRTFLSSPIVSISGAMELELFLELSFTDRAWFHEMCEEITRRNLLMLQTVWGEDALDTTVTFGGSEQCTPPMMAPEAYDEYVVPYEGKLIEWLKERGALVTVHCHGKVAHALKGMIAAGADGTDPVEPPPQGDVTYAEARAIVGDELTLIGNLQFSDLCNGTGEQIAAQVREVLSMGTRRLILGASAGPITRVDRRLVDNYKAWIDAAIDA